MNDASIPVLILLLLWILRPDWPWIAFKRSPPKKRDYGPKPPPPPAPPRMRFEPGQIYELPPGTVTYIHRPGPTNRA
jgi:hypothetical protein